MRRNEALTSVLWWSAILCLAGCGTDSTADAGDRRPNILLIVADDLGYTDPGVYGGDIDTPNIDSIANRGVLFSRFHTAPMCAPTRAMLLSGNNNHVAGMARQGSSGLAGLDYPGYENHLSDRIAPLPRLLRDGGYHTYTVGKWHLGEEAEHSPAAAGFERSWSLLQGGASHFDATGYSETGSTYRADGVLVEYPEGRYSTDFYTDKLIEFIEADRDDGRPFFAYVAYTSPHWPLQVPDEYLDRYAGRYDKGYDALREQRFEAAVDLGLVPADASMPLRNPDVTPWTDLDDDARRIEARKMELYAAMVDNLDEHIGRLFEHLQAIGEFDDTLIVFMGDNGAAHEDFHASSRFADYLQANYDNSYETMGTAKSFVSYGAGWAEAGSAPFARTKWFTREGGIVAPFVMAGAGVTPDGSPNHGYFTVMDLAPTFLEIAGVEYPRADGVQPMPGKSLVPVMSGATNEVHGEAYVTALYHWGRAYLRQGDWKISTLEEPFDEADFALFDLASDPGETVDLAADEPEKYRELIELWRVERARLGIVLPEDL